MNMEVGFSGNATPVANVGNKKDGLAPLPNIGFYGAYDFSPKIITTGRADCFSANISDYKGSLTSIYADIQYQAFKHVGFSSGCHYMKVDVEANKSNWHGHA